MKKIKINIVGDENYNKNSRTAFSSAVMENDETLMQCLNRNENFALAN